MNTDRISRAARIEALAARVGALTAEKNESYGNSYATSGAALALLFPAGIPAGKEAEALFIARVWDKLGRIANEPTAFGEDPYLDIAGYGLVGAVNAAERASRAAGQNP